MYASSEKKLDILNDHYKDTFSHLVSYRKQRDRLLVYLSVIVGIMFLYQFFPDKTATTISEIISEKTEIALDSDISLVILFSLSPLFIILGRRYWQVWNLIESQYDYLEKLETELASLFSSGVPFTRESNFSFKGQSLSMWNHRFYNLCYRSLCFSLVCLGATYGLRRYGFSWTSLIICIWGITLFIIWNFEITWRRRGFIVIPHIRERG